MRTWTDTVHPYVWEQRKLHKAAKKQLKANVTNISFVCQAHLRLSCQSTVSDTLNYYLIWNFTCQTLFPKDCLLKNHRWSPKVQRPAAAQRSPSLIDSPTESISLLQQRVKRNPVTKVRVTRYFDLKLKWAAPGRTSVVARGNSVWITSLLQLMNTPAPGWVILSLVSITLLPLLEDTAEMLHTTRNVLWALVAWHYKWAGTKLIFLFYPIPSHHEPLESFVFLYRLNLKKKKKALHWLNWKSLY